MPFSGNGIMHHSMSSDWGEILTPQTGSKLSSINNLDNWLNRVAICVALTSVSRYRTQDNIFGLSQYTDLHIYSHQPSVLPEPATGLKFRTGRKAKPAQDPKSKLRWIQVH